jgi:nucleoside-diphosphate-sugar epimerase
MATYVVTGGSGLVGRELVALLLERGHRVQAWQRTPAAASHERLVSKRFALGQALVPELERELSGVDAVVHAAWDLEPFSWADIERVNVHGSIALFEAARRAGVSKLLFVSSVSAYDGCKSLYGRSKLAVEGAVRGLGGVSVRPGVVHGDPGAGVYGRLWHSSGGRIVPLVDGGRQKLLLVHKRDLAAVIERVLADYSRWSGRTVVVGHPAAESLRSLLEKMARARGNTPTFVSVPGKFLYAGLRAAERAGLRLRFRSDSLVTLFGPDPVVVRAELDEIGVPLRSLDDALGASP